jgi:hypothetical protein
MTKWGTRMMEGIASIVDPKLYAEKFASTAGPDAATELERLKQDATVKRYLALAQPMRLAKILDSIFEQFERYVLVSKIKLAAMSPLPTGNEKLLLKNPTEATESKLDKFFKSTKSAALDRYLAYTKDFGTFRLLLPTLLERAGNGSRGSITALYTVLVEGDDHNEPIADAVRAILDGHIVLSRDLAGRNHYPAIDVLHSVSRTIGDVTDAGHRARVAQVREWLAMIRDSEDLVSIGAYTRGANPRLDVALDRRETLRAFLCQRPDTPCRYADALDSLTQATEIASS